MQVNVQLDAPLPSEFIVEMWLAPNTAVVDFPFFEGKLQNPFYPVRGPVLHPRHELELPIQEQKSVVVALTYKGITKSIKYPMPATARAVCLDVVFVEPTEENTYETCTRRRASANLQSELDLGSLSLSSIVGHGARSTLTAPLMKTRDFAFMVEPPEFPLKMNIDTYHRTKKLGDVRATLNFELGPPIWTDDDERELWRLSTAWWNERENERSRMKGRMHDLYMNPFYDANRTTPFLPGPFMTFHSYTLNATEDWWQKNVRVVKSRRPDLNVDSYDFMVRVVKCWASTRPYVRDWVWSDGRFELGDDKSVLENQTANDCEDFAWHVARAFTALKRNEFTDPELKRIQQTARKWDCFVVYGTMLSDIDDTDASAVRSTLKGDWDDSSHAFTVFLPLVTSLEFQGSSRLAIGEATVLSSPTVEPEEPMEVLTKVQAFIENNYKRLVVFEHHEHYKQPYMVVHMNVALMMRVSDQEPWAFRIQRKGSSKIVAVSELYDPTNTFVMTPVPGLTPMIPFAKKIEQLERPLPTLGKWDEKKRAEKKAWCASWPASKGKPSFSVFIDLQAARYWDERSCAYRAYDGKLDSLFDELRKYGEVTVEWDESGHFVRVDVTQP